MKRCMRRTVVVAGWVMLAAGLAMGQGTGAGSSSTLNRAIAIKTTAFPGRSFADAKTTTASANADEAAMIREYGSSKSEPIDNGFFFFNGQYIEAPYVVERRGLVIYVNGYIVAPAPMIPKDWRIFKDPGDPPPGSRPPSIFPRIAASSNDYWARKYRYLRTVDADGTAANNDYIATIRKMASVARVEADPKDQRSITITYTPGEKQIVNLGALLPPIQPKEYYIQKSEYNKKSEEDRLRSNGVEFNSNKAPGFYAVGSKSLDFIAALLSEGTPEEKGRAVLSVMGITGGPFADGEIAKVIGNTKLTPQLKVRYERIKKGFDAAELKKNTDAKARSRNPAVRSSGGAKLSEGISQ